MSSRTFLLCLFLFGCICIAHSKPGNGGVRMSSYNYGGLSAANAGIKGTINSNTKRGANYIGGQDQLDGKTTIPANKASKSSRISAWGIISIIMFIILIGAGAYYGSICYPFFCTKDNNYDIMNVSSTTTATPSGQSSDFEKMENYCSRSTTSSRSNDTGISNI